MASIHKERRNGKTYYRLQFYDKDNRRRSMRLGKINKKAADAIKAKVEDLVSASISGGSPSNETSRWLPTIGEDLTGKLATAGFGDFLPARMNATLGDFFDAYIEGRRSEVEHGTLTNFEYVRRSLVEFFGEDRSISTITEGEADDWRESLGKTYADATISKYVKRARQVFKSAVRKGVAELNVFAEVRGGSERNESRKHFVGREVTERVLEFCPDSEWRLIIGLARFGGVRTPSETLAIRWSDIDWQNERFTVTSPKTRKQGKPWRIVPLFPELRRLLSDCYDLADDGAEFVVARYRGRSCNLRTQFRRILKRAGVSPWPRLFQNLRASRETELANDFPLHVVTEWLGNTPVVADKHYLQTTEDHFQQAIGSGQAKCNSGPEGSGATGGAMVVQKSVLPASAENGQELTEDPAIDEVTACQPAIFEGYLTPSNYPARTRT